MVHWTVARYLRMKFIMNKAKRISAPVIKNHGLIQESCLKTYEEKERLGHILYVCMYTMACTRLSSFHH